MAKYLTLSGLKSFYDGFKANLLTQTQKDAITAAKAHAEAAHAPADAEKNVLVSVKVNGAAVAADDQRAVDITVPTKVGDLENDANFTTITKVDETHYTKTEIDGKVTDLQGKIADAMSGKLTKSIVEALPEVAEAKEDIIYLVPNGTEGSNVRDEYMLINGKFEVIGSTAVEMGDYIKKADVEEISTDDIDAIINGTAETSE